MGMIGVKLGRRVGPYQSHNNLRTRKKKRHHSLGALNPTPHFAVSGGSQLTRSKTVETRHSEMFALSMKE